VAGGRERELRGRIRSVQATKKITRAFELIAASQIVRAQQRIAANRPFREGMARIVVEAALADPQAAQKLLTLPEELRSVGVVAVVGDRGLSGAYNSSALRATERLLVDLGRRQIEPRLYTVGKKAQSYFRFRRQPVERAFVGMSDRPTFGQAREVANAVSAPFMAGETEQVLLVSTRYLSAGRQVVETRQLLPLEDPNRAGEPGADGAEADGAGSDRTPVATGADDGRASGGYTEFEPDVESLLGELTPRAVESEIFAALLEASASEHTARQRAMAAATENADELIRTYSRIMNRERQDSITTEIMEIVGGAEALRASKGA